MDPAKTSETLHGLLSHMQAVETKFAQVLMESTLKMMTLTDSNVFILVEMEDKRLFGGKKHLCDLFSKGLLNHSATDVEMEVDLNCSSLTPKPFLSSNESRCLSMGSQTQHQPQMQQQQSRLHFENTGKVMSTEYSRQTLKRKFGMNLESSPKRMKVEPAEIISLEIKTEGEQSNDVDDFHGKIEENFIDFFGDDNDQKVFLDTTGATRGKNPKISATNNSKLASDRTQKTQTAIHDQIRDCEISQLLMKKLSRDPKTAKKLEVVNTMTNLETKLSDATERRILSSLFYSLGGFITLKLHKVDKSSRNNLFHIAWNLTPNIHPFANKNVSRSSTNATKRTKLYALLKDNFFSFYRYQKSRKERMKKE